MMPIWLWTLVRIKQRTPGRNWASVAIVDLCRRFSKICHLNLRVFGNRRLHMLLRNLWWWTCQRQEKQVAIWKILWQSELQLKFQHLTARYLSCLLWVSSLSSLLLSVLFWNLSVKNFGKTVPKRPCVIANVEMPIIGDHTGKLFIASL